MWIVIGLVFISILLFFVARKIKEPNWRLLVDIATVSATIITTIALILALPKGDGQNNGSTPPPVPTPTPLVIADFDTCIPRTLVGGITGVTFNEPDNMRADYLQDPADGCSAKLEYHIRNKIVTFYLKLANTNFTDYNTLSFDIRADSTVGIPTEVKVELKRSNNTEMAYYYISEVTDEWQTIDLPFTDFLPVPLSYYTEMSELVFTFELNHAGLDGAVYLDNIVAHVH